MRLLSSSTARMLAGALLRELVADDLPEGNDAGIAIGVREEVVAAAVLVDLVAYGAVLALQDECGRHLVGDELAQE